MNGEGEKRSALFTTTNVTDSTRMLHTPGEFARKNLLYVQEVGKLKSLQPHRSQREKLDSFLFLGVLKGKGKVEINEEVNEVEEGDWLLLNCMEYYAHESSEDYPWTLMWVHFNGNMAAAYYRLFIEKNGGKNVFCSADIKEPEEFIDNLMKYQCNKDFTSELRSGEILLELLNYCVISALQWKEAEEGDEQYRKAFGQIREYVNTHYYENELMKTVGERFGISEEALNREFEKMYGIELQDYILNRRFTAAKELLRFTIKSEEEIIEESGIKNVDLFRRLFIDGEGMRPEEYRMKWSQWVK